MQKPRRRQLRRAAGVGVLAVLGVVLLVGGSATATPAAAPARVLADDDGPHPAPPAPLQPTSACDDTDGSPLSSRPYATGLPVIPCLPGLNQEDPPPAPPTQTRRNLFQDNGAVFNGITTEVGAPKLTLALQAAVARIFYTVCTGDPLNACPEGFDVELPDPLPPGGYFGVVAQVYVQSPLGSQPQYGAFAAVTVTTMAFGSIPVTARITVRQATSGGTVRPLELVWGSVGNIVAGTQFGGPLSRYGAAPYYPSQDPVTYPDGDPATLYPDAHAVGPITITLDQVKVDQVPLDVGSSCTASTTLDLTAPGGWVDQVTYTPVNGQIGAYNPFQRSFLAANLDIPAFQGCRSATGEDLDPLVTGLVSGRTNKLDVTQVVGLTPYACLPDVHDANCYFEHPATVDPKSITIPSG